MRGSLLSSASPLTPVSGAPRSTTRPSRTMCGFLFLINLSVHARSSSREARLPRWDGRTSDDSKNSKDFFFYILAQHCATKRILQVLSRH